MLYKKSLILLLAIISFTKVAFSQETSANLSGTITDGKGGAVNSATISLRHTPTGTVSTTKSNNKGLYNIPNLKTGGPYTLTITSASFKSQTFENLSLNLGNNTPIDIQLNVDQKELNTVIVKSTSSKPIGGTTIDKSKLNMLPTIGRSLNDFTRLTPQSNNNSFGGSNFRYNNLTIDGAINNDAIGFSNSIGGTSGGGQSGAAGAGTRTNPYSLDAIQEVQVQLAPYDVKLGNFTGGSVNAVTKSGTNTLHGSAYVFYRNQALVGKSADGLKSKIGSDFHENQLGASLGGALIKDKAFFFVNYEQTSKQEPTFYNAGDPGAAITLVEADAIKNNLATKYGYDAGTYGKYKIFTNSDKLFTRFDFNLSKNSGLMVRAIYTNGIANNLERSSTNFQFSSTDFTQHTQNINIVSELKTKINDNVSNKLNVSYINVHEYRDFPGTLAPFIDIAGGRIWAGTWREASIYNMKQKTFEISDNVTVTKGINKFTFGTHNEFYNINYGFINSWNGRWEYSGGVNSFLADQPSRIRGAFVTSAPGVIDKTKNDRNYIYDNPPNAYNVSLLSAYAQDEIAFSKRFKIAAGLRVDYSGVGSQPNLDEALAGSNSKNYVSANPTYSNTSFDQLNNKWLGKATVSPRLGFNYDVNGNQSVVIRGGAGVFVGRMPFAWLGYAYTLAGNYYGNIDWNNITGGTKVPLAINPQGLKDTVNTYGGPSRSATRELDVIDNNFKLPKILRTSIATDFKFGNGYKATFDVLYTKTLQDVKFQQINLKDSVAYFSTGPTQSPVYVGGKYNTAYSNVFFLTNTKEGYRYNITGQISKTSNNVNLGGQAKLNYNWSAAYTYGVSKDVSNGIRNSFQSNYELNPTISSNSSPLAASNFDLRHRVVALFGSSFIWNKMNTTSVAFFYSAQSGNPYSLVYQSAPFGNGSNAPLPYIPKNQADINLADYTLNGSTYTAAQQWQDLDKLISGDFYLSTKRGQYAERNGMRTPWNKQLDMKIMHEFKLSKTKNHSLQISLDLFNVANLLSNTWGHVFFVTNTNNYTVNFLKFATDAAAKKPGAPSTGYSPTFNYVKPTGIDDHYYTVDPINSRWQGQFGLRYSF